MIGRILCVIAQEKFRDEELSVPKAVFEAAGYRVDVAAPERKQCSGSVKSKVFPDLTVGEARAADFAAVSVTGGNGAVRDLWNDPALLKLLRDVHAAGRPVGGICLAGAVPAQAGLLKGKRATVWPEDPAIAELRKGGAEYVPGQVVVSDRVVTAPGPDHARAYAEALLGELEKAKKSL
jgi:protease I